MGTRNFDVKKLLNDRKFWFASFLIGWAAALQGHMMWLQRQDSFKEKFGTLEDQNADNKQKSTEDSFEQKFETLEDQNDVNKQESTEDW